MSHSAITANVHQALDIHRDLCAEGTFDLDAPVNHLTQSRDFLIAKIANPGIRVDIRVVENLFGNGVTDSEDICQGRLYPFVSGQINASNTSHLSLPLLMPRIALADNADNSAPSDYATMLAYRFNTRTYLHTYSMGCITSEPPNLDRA